ncbi:uncharacterized protein LOC112589072 [Harpegnathos saltator]|uniref:uncharacterized protein LOC112589072 n=1 Tax=Harpegnathos saltator TaxID=610380 RepID=UPI000DBED87A|nr:uncharacterized protein LOC112589072 [Harpegnathos saltator]
MQKIEARKWQPQKETFDQYALDKLALMHRHNFSIGDAINLLAGGIMNSSLRATALAIQVETTDEFLEKMRLITEGVADLDKRPQASTNISKNKDVLCRNCRRTGHSHRECRRDASCFYCKEKGHRQYECPALQRRNGRTQTAAKPPSNTATSNGMSGTVPRDAVAIVEEKGSRLVITNPFVKVNKLGDSRNRR